MLAVNFFIFRDQNVKKHTFYFNLVFLFFPCLKTFIAKLFFLDKNDL